MTAAQTQRVKLKKVGSETRGLVVNEKKRPYLAVKVHALKKFESK